jgi:hypothetical protein
MAVFWVATHADWYEFTDVSEVCTASITRSPSSPPDEGGTKHHSPVGKLIPVNMLCDKEDGHLYKIINLPSFGSCILLPSSELDTSEAAQRGGTTDRFYFLVPFFT